MMIINILVVTTIIIKFLEGFDKVAFDDLKNLSQSLFNIRRLFTYLVRFIGPFCCFLHIF